MRYKSMDLYHGFQVKGHSNLKTIIASGHHTHLVVIKLSRSWLLKLMSRAVILAMFILSFPWLNMVIEGIISRHQHEAINGSSNNDQMPLDSVNAKILPLLFHDLANEGLLKLGDKAIFVSDGNEKAISRSKPINKYGMDVIHSSELEHQSLINIAGETLDFVFAYNYYHATSSFINRSLRIGGIVVIQLSNNPMVAFKKPSNYKIVYLRKFDATFMAMRKISHGTDDIDSSATQRKLLSGTTTEAKRAAALKNLEDVLLEPPRAASGKSSRYLKHTRYLPDLMGDSLESYPRRVFIDVGLHDKNNAASSSEDDDDYSWFLKHYPTRKQKFEMYKVDTVTVESLSDQKEASRTGMSDWLKKNVKENEYVVMKAEAEVAEEMVKSKAIKLVDELFLECKHQGIKRGKNKSRRAYWECLALYGILKDEGIAVHQWWG